MAVGTFVFYHYNPSSGAAGLFVALFTLSAICHLYQLFRFRTWYFIPFLIGCVFEAVGYGGREVSSMQTPNWTTIPYIIQSLLLLLGPALLAASIYMILGRLIRLLDADSYALIRPSRLTKFFVIGDVLSFLAQSGGGGMLANAKTQSDMNLGENVITGGLVIQILFFGFFIAVTVVFHRRIFARPTARSLSISVPWRRYILQLYAASVLIMIRSVFRVAEYAGGYDGPLQSSEVYIYAFDATLMFLVVLMFNVSHPSAIVSRGKRVTELSDTESYVESHPMYGRTRDDVSQYRGPPSSPRPYNGGR